MIVDALIDGAELQRVIEKLGGRLVWPDEASVLREATVEVHVDNGAAYEALPSSFFEHWLEDPRDTADEADLGDFVRAITTGDRLVANALAARLWWSPRNNLAYERASQRAFAL